MTPRSHLRRGGLTRRGFLVGAAAGLAGGVPLGWLARNALPVPQPSPSRPAGEPVARGMPGPFPGRVVEVKHPGSVRDDNTVVPEAVADMMERGMARLTGADHAVEAWRRLFGPGDVVGIKVNPVGRKPFPGEGRTPHAVGCVSSPEVLLGVVDGLKSAGVKPRDIIVFERYADEFVNAGYDEVMKARAMDGVRWHASAAQYHNGQIDIAGFDKPRDSFSPELARQVVGYDPDVFVSMGFAAKEHDPKDDRRFRSHLSVIVTRMVSKIITIPCLKDHRSAGVTLALKNLSHGLNNNVARSHLSDPDLPGVEAGPNQCNTFIPTAVAQRPILEKATLHVLDGLIGVYEGGPGSWNKTWATWRHRGLFFATDPVALDKVCWRIIDAKRAEMGWPPVAEMGLIRHHAASVKAATAVAGLAPASYPEALTTAAAEENVWGGRASEIFTRRQPEHVLLAEKLGLGLSPGQKPDHQIEVLGAK